MKLIRVPLTIRVAPPEVNGVDYRLVIGPLVSISDLQIAVIGDALEYEPNRYLVYIELAGAGERCVEVRCDLSIVCAVRRLIEASCLSGNGSRVVDLFSGCTLVRHLTERADLVLGVGN